MGIIDHVPLVALVIVAVCFGLAFRYSMRRFEIMHKQNNAAHQFLEDKLNRILAKLKER